MNPTTNKIEKSAREGSYYLLLFVIILIFTKKLLKYHRKVLINGLK